MPNLFKLKTPNEIINSYYLKRDEVYLSLNKHMDYFINVFKVDTKLTSYDQYYRNKTDEDYRNNKDQDYKNSKKQNQKSKDKIGGKNAVYFDNFQTEKKDDFSHTLYFRDIHNEELSVIINSNQWLLNTNDFKFIIKDAFVREIFYWKALGYSVNGFDDVQNDSSIESLKYAIMARFITNNETVSSVYELEKRFEDLVEKPDYEFAKECDIIMNELGIPNISTEKREKIIKELSAKENLTEDDKKLLEMINKSQESIGEDLEEISDRKFSCEQHFSKDKYNKKHLG